MISRKTQSRDGLHNLVLLAGYAGLMLVATPVLLRALGPETYGLWMVATGLMLLGIHDFVVVDATVDFAPKRQVQGSAAIVAQFVPAAVLLDVVVGAVAGALLYLLAPALPALFKVSAGVHDEAVLMFRIAAVGIPANLLRLTLLGWLDEAGRSDLSHTLRLGFAVTASVGSMLIALVGGGGAAVVAWAVLVSWLAMAVEALSARRTVATGWRRLTLLGLRKRRLFQFSVPMLMNQGAVALGYTHRLVVGILLGPIAVAYYAIASSLAAKISLLAVASAQIFAPVASETDVSTRTQGTYSLIRRSAKRSAIVLLATGALMFALCNPFLRAWLGVHHAEGISAAAHWLILAYSLSSLSVVFLIVVRALGASEVNVALWIVACLGAIGVMLVLCPLVGLTGAAIASFAFLLMLGANAYAIRRFGQPVATELRYIYGPSLAAFAVSVGWAVVSQFVLQAPLFGALAPGALFLFLLWKSEPAAMQALQRRFLQDEEKADGVR
jgi:O-antigen/teichoic acid export membrane protein